MNGLFSDFFKEFWKGILGGVRDYLVDILGGFWRKNERKIEEAYTQNKNPDFFLYNFLSFTLLFPSIFPLETSQNLS